MGDGGAITRVPSAVRLGSMSTERVLDIPELYRRYGDLVLGRCRTLLRNDEDAQDTLQEVFLKLHRYRDSFRGESSPSTFLFKITTTTCLNRIRTKKRHPEDLVEVLPEPAGDRGGSGESVLDQLAVRELLDRLLTDEGDRTRECLVYHYVDGMTHDEAGEMIGISGAAVRKRITTFKTSLRERPPLWLQEVER